MGITAVLENGTVETLTSEDREENFRDIFSAIETWLNRANSASAEHKSQVAYLEAAILVPSLGDKAIAFLERRLSATVERVEKGYLVQFSGPMETVFSYIMAITATVVAGATMTEFKKLDFNNEHTKAEAKGQAQYNIKNGLVRRDCILVKKVAELNGSTPALVYDTMLNWGRADQMEVLKVAYELTFGEPFGKPRQKKVWEDDPNAVEIAMAAMHPDPLAVGRWNLDR
jgi:hypothetical protein